MDLYSKNLELLQEKAKSLYIKLKEEDPLYNYKVEEVEGQNNYIIQNDVSRCFLHSIYDVQREMKQLFREVESDVELLIIFGLGWGYSLSFIKNKFPDVKRVIFVEPFLDIFKRMSQKRNLRQLFQGIENINLILNEQPKTAAKQVTDLINEKVYEKFEICFHMSYRTLLSSYYEVFFNQLIKNIQNWKSNLATWVTQKSRWTVNTFNNVRKKHISAENILPSLKNLPVIIVSAGPSLERNMHLLSGVNDRALIVAVGSAIKILDTHDIQPHLRFAFDANSKNYNKILCDLNSYDIPLVYSDRIPPSALDKYRGKKVKMVINSNYIIHYIYDKIDKDYKIYKDGFTIANTVLSIFSELGAPEIILLGQDLCYTFDKLHAEGSWDDDREIDFSNNKFVKTTDINGEEVYTKPNFLSMKNVFERTIAEFDGIEYIDATEGGLKIDGCKNIKFKGVLNKLEGDNITDKLEFAFKQTSFCDENYFNRVDKVIQSINEENKEIINLINDWEEDLEKVKRYYDGDMGINKIFNELESLKEYKEKLSKYKFYNLVVNKMLGSIIYSLKVNYNYEGDDKYKKVESEIALQEGIINHTQRYCYLIENLIEEYQDRYNLQ